jgi:CBS domain containing-hemolysin-like protein
LLVWWHSLFQNWCKREQFDNYIISGLEEVSFFNETYGFTLSESDDYETIAGYILFHIDNLPAEGEVIEIKDDEKSYKFKILKVSDTKIEKVMLYH